MEETKKEVIVVSSWLREMARSCLKNKRQTRKRQEGSVSSLKVGSGTKSDSERGGKCEEAAAVR